jgi:autotransporter-associated beta strand protein
VNLNAAQSALGLEFDSGFAVLIQTGSGSNTLSLGGKGIDDLGSAADTISSAVSLLAAQQWRNNSSNLLTINGNVDNGANLLTVAGTGNTTISGVLGNGGGGLTKNGAGTLTLSNSNTFTGPVTINAGTVLLANGGALNSATPVSTVFGAGSTGVLYLNGNSVTVSGLSTNATVGSPDVQNANLFPASLTVNNAVDNTFAGTLQDGGAGALSLIKSGAGTLTLGGANTYTGSTTISSGTLVLGSAAALGTTAGGTTVASGATLDLGGQTVGAEPLTISGAGVGGNGALVNSSGSPATFAGNINNQSFTVGGTGDINLSGAITINFDLTKIGAGTLTLSGTTDNTVLGLRVNAGTVVLAKTSSHSPHVHAVELGVVVNGGTAQLGGTGGDQIYDVATVTVTSGAFDTNGRNETIAALNLQGTGISGDGALVSSSAGFSSLVVTDGTVLTGDTTIGVPSDVSTLFLTNVVSGNFGLTKVGGGYLILNGANTFSGGLTVRNGTLEIPTINDAGTSGPLGNNTSVTLGSSGNFGTLNYFGGTASSNMPFVLAAGGTGQIQNAGAVGTNLTLNGTISGSGNLALNGANANTVTLNGANTYTGVTTVYAGTLALGNAAALGTTAGGTTVINGATLDLNGQSVGAEPLTISGVGVGGNGALVNSSATLATFAGNITNQTFTAGGKINLTGAVTGAAALTKTEAGTLLILSGATDNTGLSLVVNDGEVGLAKASSHSPDVHAVGNMVVSGGYVRLGGTGGDQIHDSATVTVTSGTFDTYGQSETITTLNLQGTGLSSGGALANSGVGVSSTFTPTGGTVLTGDTTIGVPVLSSSLQLNNPISGNFGLTKVGGGGLTLNGANTYTGNTTVLAGTLRFATTTGSPSVGGAATASVASGATLELAGLVSDLGRAGGNRVHVVNNSTAPGVLVSGKNQVVGAVDGSGSVQINAGSDLKVNHIVQSALIIGGTAGSPAMVTIDASDALGNPLFQPSGIALAGSLAPSDPIEAGGISSAGLSSSGGSELISLTPISSVGSGNPSSVPEPSTMLLVLLTITGLAGRGIALSRHACRSND